MIPPQRLLRPLTFKCVRRFVSSRWCCLSSLFILLLVGVSFHNVAHQSRDAWPEPLVNQKQDKKSPQDQGPGGPVGGLVGPGVTGGPGADPGEGLQDGVQEGLRPLEVPDIPPEERCTEKSHLVFLKTHRTGSGSIQNILFRFGGKRGLTFALPRNRFHRFLYPMFFQAEYVENFRGRSFSILCHSMRFSRTQVSKVMPKDSFYFSILREPVSMMESMFQYFSHDSQSLDQILDYKLQNYKEPAVNTDFTHNNLAFDFGYDNTVTAEAQDLEERAKKVIAGIERDFHILLINEYFEESMILLKKSLCWSLEDVISFKLNSRTPHSRTVVSPETADKIRRWNALDWKIYLHFNQTFWERLRTHVGLEEVKREVAQLRGLQHKLRQTCLKGGAAVPPIRIRDTRLRPLQGAGANILGYNLKPDLDPDTRARCRGLITPEVTHTHTVYNQQFPEEEGFRMRRRREVGDED